MLLCRICFSLKVTTSLCCWTTYNHEIQDTGCSVKAACLADLRQLLVLQGVSLKRLYCTVLYCTDLRQLAVLQGVSL